MGKRKRKRFKIHIKPEVRRRILKPLSKALVLLLVLSLLPISAYTDGMRTVAPFTGDENNVVIWIVLIVVALAAIAAAVYFLLKKGKKPKS